MPTPRPAATAATDPAAARIRAKVTERPIGIAGLDALGMCLAGRLTSAGLRVLAWDHNTARRGGLAELGPLAEAGGLTDLGAGADVVLATLPAAELFQAAIGDAERPGFALAMAPGSLVVDLGVAFPSDAQRLAALLGRGGIGVIDAPALGPPEAAMTGGLSLPAGGFTEFIARLEPLLGLFGRVQPAGTQGRGHALAALTVYARHAEASAAREALRLGLACGLTPELMPDVAAQAASGPVPDDPRLAIARRLAADFIEPTMATNRSSH